MIIISALLHDIGKLYQRTGIWIDINGFKKYLVYSKGIYLYYHSAYTGSFLNEYLGIENITSLAASHHLRQTSIIRSSDIIAAAHDRRDSDYDNNSNDAFILMRLSSIFGLIVSNNNQILSLKKLNDFSGFTTPKKIELNKAKSEYLKLFGEFKEDFKILKGIDSKLLINYLYPILKEYTYAIPANTYKVEKSFVSLFDHSKLTAAVARCLELSDKKAKFIIVKYKLDGITDFVYQDDDIEKIYQRSCYIKLFSDFIVYAILNEFGLSYPNIMYSLGGQGRILIPNSESFINKISYIYSKINQVVNIKHDGIIDFVLSYDIYSENDLKKGKFKSDLPNNENIILKNSKIKKTNIKSVDYYSICDTIINNEIIIEYNFRNNTNNNSVIYFNELGSIIIDSKTNNDSSFYQSYNGGLIGETISYNIIRNHQINKNSVVVFMDIKNTNLLFNQKISKQHQSFSTFLTLSRTLEMFFSKIVAKICEGFNLNLIYTSGDDIVLITDKINADNIVMALIDGFKKYTMNSNEIEFNIKISEINNSIKDTLKKLKKN